MRVRHYFFQTFKMHTDKQRCCIVSRKGKTIKIKINEKDDFRSQRINLLYSNANSYATKAISCIELLFISCRKWTSLTQCLTGASQIHFMDVHLYASAPASITYKKTATLTKKTLKPYSCWSFLLLLLICLSYFMFFFSRWLFVTFKCICIYVLLYITVLRHFFSGAVEFSTFFLFARVYITLNTWINAVHNTRHTFVSQFICSLIPFLWFCVFSICLSLTFALTNWLGPLFFFFFLIVN